MQERITQLVINYKQFLKEGRPAQMTKWPLKLDENSCLIMNETLKAMSVSKDRSSIADKIAYI